MEIKNIGEAELIRRIWKVFDRKNENEDVHFFDDGEKYMLFAIDSINENFHFRRDWKPELIGKFLVDINLSDIASKNGLPREMMVSMSFPRNLEEDWILSLIKGMKDELEKYRTNFVGGDLKESDNISLTGMIIGEVEKGKEFRRSGAKAGDKIYVTSKIGKNERSILNFYGSKSTDYSKILEIKPRFDALDLFKKYRITSCIDNSDGIYKSLSEISSLGKVGIKIERNVCSGETTEEERVAFYSTGGDYELIFTSPDEINEFPLLGRVIDKDGVMDMDGDIVSSFGYDHFRTRIRG